MLLAFSNQFIHKNEKPVFLVWFITVATVLLTQQAINTGQYHLLQHLIGVSVFVLAWMHYFSLWQRALSPAVSEAQLAALTARIRPHFLFNSLNAAISLVATRPDDAEMVLENLSELFRAQLKDQLLRSSLKEELQLGEDYLAIEKIRMGEERLNVSWLIKAPPNTEIPHLLLQPLLENAVYHGIEPYHRPGTIQVNIIRKNAWLYLRIENPVFDLEASTHKRKGNQMAMKNIRERLFLLYDQDAKLTHHRLGNRYQVSIRMPYRLYGS
jgi:two-component system sensor histidine kinase AlgZ